MVSWACGVAQTRWIELNEWQFCKAADGDNGGQAAWTTVRLPHSCNAIDGQSARYYRGRSHYRTTVQKHGAAQFLCLMGAAQKSEVWLNGQPLDSHKGGYTPHYVELTPAMHEGDNLLEVYCDNSLDRELAPVSSDFNKNNGLHNMAYLVETAEAFCDFSEMGYDALHVTPLNVTRRSADIKINTMVRNVSAQAKSLRAVISIKNAKGRTVVTNREVLNVPANGRARLNWTYLMSNPHLWAGLKDPYLYTASVELWDGRKLLETNEARFGVRFYSLDPERGFMLNGEPYQLRGFSMHQDWHQSASAVTAQQTDRDFEIIKDLGMNVIRLAHYPHNRYILQKCDELGLVVQTEIPWVNECGTDTTLYSQSAYTANLHQQLREMIVNHYNHPSVVFWGLWNELGNIDGSHPQGAKLDAQCVLATTHSLYEQAHRLDSTRSVGFADASFGMRTPELRQGEHFDYFAFNAYNGWYSNCKTPEGAAKFSATLDRLHQRAPITAITEYGSGSNPYCHSLQPELTTKPSVGGARHDEEWGNIVHERHLQALESAPWLQFSTGWILFDFAVGARHEGYMLSDNQLEAAPDSAYLYLNDKGIVSRDRSVMKDAYYLYRAKWNKQAPTIHITSSRFKEIPSDSVTIKVYSNLTNLTLAQNGRVEQILTTSGEPTGVVWTFAPLPLCEIRPTDVFTVTGRDPQGHLHTATAAFSRAAGAF